MTAPRWAVAALAVLAALILQTTALPMLVGGGALVPDLCLLVVVAVGLRAGELSGAVTGFAAGLVLDLAPPADHLVGRWALGLLLAGWLAGRLASLPASSGPASSGPASSGPASSGPAEATSRSLGRWGHRASLLGRILVVVAAGSLVATSAYALSGLLFGELTWAVPELLRGLVEGVLVDVIAAAAVVPLVLRLLGPPVAESRVSDPAAVG